MPSNLEVYNYDQLGAFGLNSQEAAVVLPGQWASIADNLEFDDEGVLKPRPCIVPMIEQPAAGTYYSVHAYKWVNSSGSVFEQIYGLTSSAAYVAGGLGSSWNLTVGATLDTGRYGSVRLGDKIFFFQRNENIQVADLSVSSALADITGVATAPKPNIVCAAFGRLWGADTNLGSDDKRTLYWSVLQDGEDWSGVGSGSLDMTSVWGTSDDEITAIKEFNNFLIVFSLKRITIIGNPYQATFSNNSVETSSTMYVQDTIVGIGCISRDAAVNCGDEVVFLDYSGFYSLSRVIQEKSNPLTQLAPHIQDLMRDTALLGRQTWLQSPTTGRFVKLLYNPNTKQVYMFTSGSNHYCFHLNRRLENGGVCVTRWTGFTVEDSTLYTANDGNIYVLVLGSWTNSSGTKFGFFYGDYLLSPPSSGSARETYTVILASTWDVLQKPVQTKMLKRAIVTYQGSSITFTIKHKFNFQDSNEQTFTFPAVSGSTYKIASVPIGGSGETVLTTVSWPVTYTTTDYRINRLSLQFKAGRISAGI